MSLQTGKPWMIACDEFMDAIEAWCDDSLATQNDLVLGALVTLRLATATEFTVLIHGVKDQEQDQLKLLLSILGRRIDRWETEWSQRVKLRADPEDDGCHQFLIHFYASHIRLQLFSLPLQGMLVSADTDTTLHLDTVWTAYTNAIKLLRLIPEYAEYLYFAQDSIHVMAAYSAGFLVRVVPPFDGRSKQGGTI